MRTTSLMILPLAVISTILASTSRAQERQDVHFELAYPGAPGQSVYVLGSMPELGADNPIYAVKLEGSAFPLWRGTLSIPKGRTFTYQYTWRVDSVTSWSDPDNHNPIGEPAQFSTDPYTPTPPAHTVYYHSGWSPPLLHWRIFGSGQAFQSVAMTRAGPGRTASESRWVARGVGPSDRDLEFYFANGALRDPQFGQYRTPLTTAFVQDGHLFNYVPPPFVAPPQQINITTFFSSNLNENRPFRILLPRGYYQNPGRRYPVLYMHDGQNVFDMGPFGSWNADETAHDMIRQGQMREIIVVGVENTANRVYDYTPPDDITALGNGMGNPGRADRYAAFLIEELKPAIDASLRTLPDRENTATLGSSMGGIVSLYLGWDFEHVFSRIGPMSGAWPITPRFTARVTLDTAHDIRIYLDSGDTGTLAFDNAESTMDLRDSLMAKGYVLERTLKHVVGYGHDHNEAAWSARLPVAYRFLFPATEEHNSLDRMLSTAGPRAP